ncbi:Agouti-related protein, partial [Chaetura pelagica]
CRLSPRTMLNVLLLCCGLLQGIQAVLAAEPGHGHLKKGMEGADRAGFSSLLREAKDASAAPAGTPPRLWFEQMSRELQEADGDLVQRGSVVEPQGVSAELEAEGREQRSPRRCLRLLESCLGQHLPCCHLCATCYCRFFNAVCYCKKTSSNVHCGKN